MIDSELLKCKILENSVSLLADFFNVLSDGYNPTIIGVDIDLVNSIDEKGRFIFPSHNGIGSEVYFTKNILPTKIKVQNIESKINENFNWSLNHLITFNDAPKIFGSNFHMDNLTKLLERIKYCISDLIGDWAPVCYEYTLDTRDGSLRRTLFIHGKNKSMILEFGNYIH